MTLVVEGVFSLFTLPFYSHFFQTKENQHSRISLPHIVKRNNKDAERPHFYQTIP